MDEHVSAGRDSNRFSRLANIEGDSDDGFQTVTRRHKRQRRSTGGTSYSPEFSDSQFKLTKEEFKALPADDKLVKLFELMTSVGLQNARLCSVEENVYSLNSQMQNTQDRVKLLEYKSIDIECRSRRNNLIFRGIQEHNDIEDCESLIKAVVEEKLGLDPNMCIQRAHRLGSIQKQNRNNRNFGQNNEPPKPRPIIACFRDYPNVETILLNAHKLKNTNLGIHRDYPKEVVNARARLWPLYKSEKTNNPRAKVYIGFPAKVVVNGRVIENLFPDWYQVLRGSRVYEAQKGEIKNVTAQNGETSNIVRAHSLSETDDGTRNISIQMESEHSDHETEPKTLNGSEPSEVQPDEAKHVDQTTPYDEAMMRLSQLPVATEQGATAAPPPTSQTSPDSVLSEQSSTNG